ncbi:MAG: methyltransferase domain-containing protein [Gammaproteobacteria bacterium]|nr:methyltransferase domain-containing protein [Gammaproteobacteria bacterium]
MKPPVFNPAWSEEVKRLYHHDMQEIWDPKINIHIWNQYHNQLDLYLEIAGKAQPNKAKKILDVGCAQGTLALLLGELGHNVWAVDLRDEFLEYAKTRYTYGNVEFLQGNVLVLDMDERFDLIFANQIIEHLVYPNQLISRLGQMLAENGRLVITTPNWHYLMNRLPSYRELGDPAQYEEMQFTADGDGHFFSYSAKELVEIFEQESFTQVDFRYFETPFISGHMKMRYCHYFAPVRLLRFMDRAIVNAPVLGRLLAHQLMVTGARA